jgi:cyclomaltodextrinase / maltogenic alpha-amylase / neopullulanase
MAKTTSKKNNSLVIYSIYPRAHTKSSKFIDIIPDLPRIKTLGTDVIWLMPVHPLSTEKRKGSLGSPYAIYDYRGINPEYGNEGDFSELVEAIHKSGVKIMIDVVYNHAGAGSLPEKEHPEWFLRINNEISRKCEDWSDVHDFDFKNRGLWDYLIASLQKWSDCGVDGFRCDVASLVPVEFWNEARKVINSKRDTLWLAESVHKNFIKSMRSRGFTAHSDPELHEAFDLTYDYDGFEYLQEFFTGKSSLAGYINHLFIQETLYPDHAIKLRFLENHDNPRAARVFNGMVNLKNWSVFYALLPGALLIYAGQEIAEKHTPSLFEKEIIDWENGDAAFQEFFKNLMVNAKNIKTHSLTFEIDEITGGVYRIVWKGNYRYTAIVNLQNRFGSIPVDFKLRGINILDGNECSISENFDIEKSPILVKN